MPGSGSIGSKRKRRRTPKGVSRRRRVSNMNSRASSHCVQPGLRRIDFGENVLMLRPRQLLNDQEPVLSRNPAAVYA
jgi:hypothetical protein